MKIKLILLLFITSTFCAFGQQPGLWSTQSDASNRYLILQNPGFGGSSMLFGSNFINTSSILSGPYALRLQSNGNGNVSIGSTTAGTSSSDARLTINSGSNQPDINFEGHALLASQGNYQINLDSDNLSGDEQFRIFNGAGDRLLIVTDEGHLKTRSNLIVGGGNNSGSPDVGTVLVRHLNSTTTGGIRVSNQNHPEAEGWLMHHNVGTALLFYNETTPEVSFTVDGSINALSDFRFKNNINPLHSTSMLDKLNKLRPVSFIYNHDNNKRPVLGHIAQEVEKIFPELTYEIDHEGDKAMMLSVNQFIPILVSSIQEQSKIINKLTARLKIVEEQLK